MFKRGFVDNIFINEKLFIHRAIPAALGTGSDAPDVIRKRAHASTPATVASCPSGEAR